MAAPTPPAGWYKRPSNPNQERYWDGAAWTDHVRDVSPAEPPPPSDLSTASPSPPSQATDSGEPVPPQQPAPAQTEQAGASQYTGPSPQARKIFPFVVAGAAVLLVVIIVVAGITSGGKKAGGSGGTGTYTRFTFDNKQSGCGEQELAVGETTTPTFTVTNTSGHPWAQTYIWVSVENNMAAAKVSMNGQQSIGLPPGNAVFVLGPLASGATGTIKIELVGKGVGQETVVFKAWGSASASIPEFSPQLPQENKNLSGGCRYSIS